MVPLFTAQHVYDAVPPARAVDAVRDAFVAFARGEWTMPPKVYVGAYPAGDFRAMPALGGGHALLKWVTSFPGNPAKGLPTVMGVVLVSSAEDGRLVAVLDAGAVTAVRTGAAAVLAAETLGRADAETAAVVGAGVNGEAAARTFAARGRAPLVWDVDAERAAAVAERVGGRVRDARRSARRRSPRDGDARPRDPSARGLAPPRPARVADGARGADGPGKAEIAVAELARVRVFCDDWEQASHGGECAAAVEAGVLARADVTEIGSVLTGDAEGRRSPDDTTAFDSTGLALQDLAVALVALERAPELDLPTIAL